MNILIVGCGISSLAIYRALRKHLGDTPGISIKVVDSLEPATRTRSVGGGLGIAPNGLRAINSLSPDAVSYLKKDGFQLSSMTSGLSAIAKGACWDKSPSIHNDTNFQW